MHKTADAFRHGGMTRREILKGLVAGLIPVAMAGNACAAGNPVEINRNVAYGGTTLPAGIRSRFIKDINGLNMHILEAGFESKDRPCVILLHGFPELAYSWRKVMLPLSQAGFHVVAPDQRGYGRTTGWDGNYDGDVGSFRFLNLVRDTLGLVHALGYHSVAAVVGHDFGSPVAAWCSLVRPDVFRSAVMMSAPFGGSPSLPFNTADAASHDTSPSSRSIHDDLAALPRPRKHYQRYYSTREANDNMRNCPQGVHDFLRAYYHFKSADWEGNKPFPLKAWSAGELAQLPAYYIMDRAYIDFERLYEWHQAKTFFVTRAKSNFNFRRRYSRKVDNSTGVLCDQTVMLTTFYPAKAYPEPLRRIKYIDQQTGEKLVFMTNDFELPAITIAKLYKARWQIELFFKWIKQHLRIKAFYGTSLNAVKTQIWVAISTYLLVAIVKKELRLESSLYTKIGRAHV